MKLTLQLLGVALNAQTNFLELNLLKFTLILVIISINMLGS